MNVLITGKNSYLAGCIEKKLAEKGCCTKKISVRNKIDNSIFDNIDTVIHCAAIVHTPSVTDEDIYDRINHRLTVELAVKCKKNGVKHFIFLSTMSVYGKTTGIIDSNTPLNPATPYGISKLKAEKALAKLQSDTFSVTIIRPPMVYGGNCPGNYAALRKMVLKLPVFPAVNNRRSMIYSSNLAYFICDAVIGKMYGIYLPANENTVNTAYLAKCIAKANNKKIYLSKLLGYIAKLLPLKSSKKAFSSLCYSDDCVSKCNYVDFEKSIIETEKDFS